MTLEQVRARYKHLRSTAGGWISRDRYDDILKCLDTPTEAEAIAVLERHRDSLGPYDFWNQAYYGAAIKAFKEEGPPLLSNS